MQYPTKKEVLLLRLTIQRSLASHLSLEDIRVTPDDSGTARFNIFTQIHLYGKERWVILRKDGPGLISGPAGDKADIFL